MEKLILAAEETSNMYVFDPFEKFCDNKFCYTGRKNIFFYVDNDHLSKEGALYISKDLLSLIRHINSQKNNANN